MTSRVLHDAEVRSVVEELNKQYDGMYEIHPFLTGWYNKVVSDHDIFDLPYDDNTLAFTVFTLPAFFERVYAPWLRQHYDSVVRDPIDKCFDSQMSEITEKLSRQISEKTEARDILKHSESNTLVETRTIYDFQLHPVRRNPMIVMQVAAHVSGGAFYYRPDELPAEKLAELELACSRRSFGVALHPKFGGWFAIRAVIVMPRCTAALRQREPIDPLGGDLQARFDLLLSWTRNWRDPQWRDGAGRLALDDGRRYSSIQRRYFAAAANERDRKAVIEEIISSKDADKYTNNNANGIDLGSAIHTL